jgi:hypothetical protein
LQVPEDVFKLAERGAEVVGNLLSEHVRIGQV